MAFNFFKKKEPEFKIKCIDKMYVSQASKINAVLALAAKDFSIIFIAWFHETQQLFIDLFVKNNLDSTRILNTREIQNLHSGYFFLEHHPYRPKEIELLTKLGNPNFTVFNGLDEPFFKKIGSENIIAMMHKLGMKDDECLEHHLISNSILHYQQKIEKKIIVEMGANSQKEWIERNVTED